MSLPFFSFDLHVHGKYSDGASRSLSPADIIDEAVKVGLTEVGTGDCLHSLWLSEWEEYLATHPIPPALTVTPTCELCCVWGKGRKCHILLIFPSNAPETLQNAPNFDSERVPCTTLQTPSSEAKKTANLSVSRAVLERVRDALGVDDEDGGRPHVYLHPAEVREVVKKCDRNILVGMAHVLTPHYGFLGAQCKGTVEELDEIEPDFVESGLSATPGMITSIPGMQKYKIVSFSDAHSKQAIGRELTISTMSPFSTAFRYNALQTIEHPPELGKYYWSGHRKCGVSSESVEVCHVCRKKYTQGVVDRIHQLRGTVPQIDLRTSPYIMWIKPSVLVPPYTSYLSMLLNYDRCGEEGEKLFRVMYNYNIQYIPGYDGQYGEVIWES